MRRSLLMPLLAAAALMAAEASGADPASTFGLFSRPAALAGAGAATAHPADAALTNPASAGFGSRTSVKASYLYAHPMLTYDGQQADVPDAHGVTLGLRIPLLTLTPKGHHITFGLGLGIHVPDRWLARIYLIEPSRPSFVMWEGQVHRMVATPVLAVALDDIFSVGAGATLLADGAGSARLTLGYEGAQTRTDAQLDLDLRLRAAPVLGVTVHPVRWLTLAAGWTGELGLDMQLDVAADLDAPGLEGDTLISIRGTSDYTPHTLWAALSFSPIARLQIHVRWAWVMWSRANPFFARMRMMLDVGGDPSFLQSMVPEGDLRDAWVLSVGVEGAIPLPHQWTLTPRAGYQYRPTPVPAQSGFTTYADSDVHVMATGLGFSSSPANPVQLTLGWALQVQRLVPRTTTKDPAVHVIQDFEIQGWVVATMLDASLTF